MGKATTVRAKARVKRLISKCKLFYYFGVNSKLVGEG